MQFITAEALEALRRAVKGESKPTVKKAIKKGKVKKDYD